MRRGLSAAVVPAALLFLMSCSSTSGGTYGMNTGPTGGNTGGGNSGGPPMAANVAIVDYYFGPANVTIARGGSVTWANDGVSAHTVTADSGGFSSGQLAGSSAGAYGQTAGGSFAWTFTQAGTYTYHCSNHPAMTGTVTVQ